MPTRLQLRGESVEGLHAKVLSSYPAGSRLIEAEKVTEGGIGKFFARTFYEGVVEVPDPVRAGEGPAFPDLSGSTFVARAGGQPLPPRAGVAALLANADSAEAAMHGVVPAAPAVPEVSTATRSFDTLLDSLSTATGETPEEDTDGPVPSVLGKPGDAVLVIGIGADALATARSMAAAAGSSSVRTAGSYRVEGIEHVVGRQGVVSARAAAVIGGEPLFIAFGLGLDGSLRANALAEMKPDQTWLAVDATRKPSDTEAWVRKAGWAVPVDALAVLGRDNTLTPTTVNDLDLPIGWIDNRRAVRSVL